MLFLSAVVWGPLHAMHGRVCKVLCCTKVSRLHCSSTQGACPWSWGSKGYVRHIPTPRKRLNRCIIHLRAPRVIECLCSLVASAQVAKTAVHVASKATMARDGP